MITMYGSPITFMNRKQLRFIARSMGLDYSVELTQPELVALIEG